MLVKSVPYFGSCAAFSGTWVGVEWDQPSRGKHDGSTGGVRYFECLSGPTAGSFIRSGKVHCGETVLNALQERYFNQKAEGSTVAEDKVYISTARRDILVEMVGEEQVQQRQSQLNLLTRARCARQSAFFDLAVCFCCTVPTVS